MTSNIQGIDKVRASREGHEYHEVWTARKAMQLLLPDDTLIGIAVEGLAPSDQSKASSDTVEIADLTLYYGKAATFRGSDRVEIVQFKYSISRADTEYRASDAKKTIEKFAEAYRDHKKNYSAKNVRDKLFFELITNRPIFPPLIQAVSCIAEGKSVSGVIKTQADQFKKACGLNGGDLIDFAHKCAITGLMDNLADAKRGLSNILVDWSATHDTLAAARLGEMRQLVRDKAGYAGTNRNVIRRTDILAAFGISDIDELLPCPEALADVGEIVEREQLKEAVSLIPSLTKPLLIHGAGGIGKTVFMESLARALKKDNEVVFFDCFGGGAYRSYEDSRHLPRYGLVHIINTLACRGLCDPMLPGSSDVEILMKTFRRRLEQCVMSLSKISLVKELLLFIDAIDNSADCARDRGHESFPTILIESLVSNPIAGIKVIASSRSHRIPIKATSYHDFLLNPFSENETETYLRSRLPDVKNIEIRVAQARSGGNARILEYLLDNDRGLLDPSEIDEEIKLDDLIQARIDNALSIANERGSSEEETDAFLAGLAVLPPPVPLDEYAAAHGMELSAIESFASDLWPLLERTKHGLMFRDEPTETLIRDKYASIDAPLRRISENLLSQQDRSVYAARALPGLLYKIGDGDRLFQLAFDERIPAAITSTVGKRNIRYARLKAAVTHSANNNDYDSLTHLLLEISTITAVNQKGADYILDNPDLVVAAKDIDATRRLFEIRTTWPGSRHARLAIANALTGDIDEAFRHAIRADEWIYHYRQEEPSQRVDKGSPERLDIAAIPFILIAQNRPKRAAQYMKGWLEWYSFEVGENLFGLLQQYKCSEYGTSCDLDSFLEILSNDIGSIAAALSFLELKDKRSKDLIGKLSRACKRRAKLKFRDNFSYVKETDLSEGLRKSSAIAMALELHSEALVISDRASPNRPGIWSMRDHFSGSYVFPYLYYAALKAAVKGQPVRDKDILPKELMQISSNIKNSLSGEEFRKEVKKRLERRYQLKKTESDSEKRLISYEEKQEAERFINNRLEPLLKLTNALSELLVSPLNRADKAFLNLLNVWGETRTISERYGLEEINPFFNTLGCQIATFALWARSDLKLKSVKELLRRLHEQAAINPSTILDVVSTLAKRKNLVTLAGEQALKASSLIQEENEVSYRSKCFAHLARAILPASIDEATAYFKAGLDQMDAIGSGDYEYTNELLLFASTLKGNELEDKDFHTLTNICELNLTDEPEKFPWYAFGRGLSKASGCKGLAKLSRWDDRSKVSLDYTLLPYLTALVESDKITPADAVAVNYLADPVELHSCNSAAFADVIIEKCRSNKEKIFSELVNQYILSNCGLPMDSTIKTFAMLSKEILGKNAKITKHLSGAHIHFRKVRQERNKHLNYRGGSVQPFLRDNAKTDSKKKAELRRIINKTNPVDEQSLEAAINDLNQIEYIYDHEEKFFDDLRNKVAFNDRAKYIKVLSGLEHLNLYRKLEILQACKEEWKDSSASLEEILRDIAKPLIKMHADDLISGDRLSGYKLKEISEISRISVAELALEIVKIYAEPEYSITAPVWLDLAGFVCEVAHPGEGQAALKRLLNSEAAKLSSSVQDGEWARDKYPEDNIETIISDLIWFRLGSPYASDRWRAAHCMRCFVRLGKWNVIDQLITYLSRKDAKPFQAPELQFYFLHAKLWLLIGIARIALDNPKNIARYKDVLVNILEDQCNTHVLIRHFAAQALLVCMESGEIHLTSTIEKNVRETNQSRFPLLHKENKYQNDFYRGRPDSKAKPDWEFHLDYDFHKHDVQSLSQVFGKSGWEVCDLISDIVKHMDHNTHTMYEAGGRSTDYHGSMRGMSTGYHHYGQQLGWHAMQIAAGRLLNKDPVTDGWYYDRPWYEWLHRYLPTRSDGLWLSDGIDWKPIDISGNLLEEGKKELVLTGDQKKILRLIDISSGKEIVTAGSWQSTDNIDVDISSVLSPTKKSKKQINDLLKEEPFGAWLPDYSIDENGEEYISSGSEKEECIPWIVSSSVEPRLDENDPLGSIDAMRKPYIATQFVNDLHLHSDDPFSRIYKTRRGRVMARTEAWGCSGKYSNEQSVSGKRLLCNRDLIANILTKYETDLIILIKLRRYEEGGRYKDSKFSHTVAVVKIDKLLNIKYHKGHIN